MNLFTPLWFAWGAMFLGIEFTAIWARKTGRYKGNGTLSALVWRFTNTKTHKVQRVAFFAAFVYLGGHFAWKWPLG